MKEITGDKAQCNNCGAAISPYSVYCPQCGYEPKSAATASANDWFSKAGSLDGSSGQADPAASRKNTSSVHNGYKAVASESYPAKGNVPYKQARNEKATQTPEAWERTPPVTSGGSAKASRCKKCGSAILPGETLCSRRASKKNIAKKTAMQAEKNSKESMLFCTACGKPTPSDSAFCEHCGKRLLQASARPRFRWKWWMTAATCCAVVVVLLLCIPWPMTPAPENSGDGAAHESTDPDSAIMEGWTEEATEDSGANDIFDGTYWHMSFGQSLGFNYIAKFSSDGSFVAKGMGSGAYENGTYTYSNGKLEIVFDIDGFGYPSTIKYSGDASGFTSLEQYPMQVGEECYWISPDSDAGRFFNESTETTLPQITPTETQKCALPEGEYYGRLESWTADSMTVELLSFDGIHEFSENYLLSPTGEYVSMDISQAEIALEWYWNQREVSFESIDAALDSEIDGWGGTTIRDASTMEILFTVQDDKVNSIIFLYAA